MYRLSIRKTCKALRALQAIQKCYGYVVDYSLKSVYVVYGFDVEEIPVIEQYIKIHSMTIMEGATK